MELTFLSPGAIVAGTLARFLPVWIGMAAIMGASYLWRGRLGTYGRIYDSTIGIVGFGLVLFWLLTAITADWVAVFDPYAQIRALQNKPPGAIEAESGLRVRMEFDVEANKNVGLAQRIREEAARPRCDVFWSNEFAQIVSMAEDGLLVPYVSPSAADIPPHFRDPAGRWTGFAARARKACHARSTRPAGACIAGRPIGGGMLQRYPGRDGPAGRARDADHLHGARAKKKADPGGPAHASVTRVRRQAGAPLTSSCRRSRPSRPWPRGTSRPSSRGS